MILSSKLQNKIIENLTSLPNIHGRDSQVAFINSAGLEPELLRQIIVGGAPLNFFQLLLATSIDYGQLKDGRHPLEAILNEAKRRVGTNKRGIYDECIQELVETIAKEQVETRVEELELQLEAIKTNISSLKEKKIDPFQLQNAENTKSNFEKDLRIQKQKLDKLERQQKNPSKILSEFEGWQKIYWATQDLLTYLRMPHEFLLKWTYDPKYISIDSVAEHWQKYCLTNFEKLKEDIEDFQYAKSSILENVRTYPAKKFTKKFRIIEAEPTEFDELYIQFNEFKDILFHVLNLADKRMIMLTAYTQNRMMSL